MTIALLIAGGIVCALIGVVVAAAVVFAAINHNIGRGLGW